MDDAQKLAVAGKHKEATEVLTVMIKELEASKYKDEQFIKILISELKESVVDVSPKVYGISGAKHMKHRFRGHMQQRSHPMSG